MSEMITPESGDDASGYPSGDWLGGDAEAVAVAAGKRADTLTVVDLTQAEFATLALDRRIAVSVGHFLEIELRDGTRCNGKLSGAGRGWLVLEDAQRDCLVLQAAITQIVGLSRHASPEALKPATAPSVGSVFRRWSAQRARVSLRLVNDQVTGTITRVGRDALDVSTHPIDRPPTLVDPVVTIPFAALNCATAPT